MHTILPTRKARFKSALARTGLTQKEWCRVNGISYLHLYHVVLHEETDAMVEKVDRFIENVEAQAAA